MGSFDLTKFAGIFSAAMTMFETNGVLNERATLAHWEWLVEKGANGLVIAGTSAEFIALTLEERARLFDLAIWQFEGKVSIVAGSGDYSTKLTIELSQRAEQAGADALIAILPY